MKIKIFVLSILIVLISIVIEKCISNQYQIPAMRMREGLIVKKLQKMALVGGDSFFLSRSSMSGNRLNLAHWYGNQEIRHINDKAILKTRYKINFSKDSDIFVFWNHSGSSVDGIRLENNEKLTLRKQNNDMVTTKLLSRIGLLPEKIVLELEQVGKDIQIELNEKKYLVPDEYLGGTWGIRADETKVEVEEIKTIYADSSNYFQTFGTEFNLRFFILALVSMSLICLLLMRISLNSLLYFKYLVLVLVSTLYFVDQKLMSVQQVEALTGSLKPVKENGFWGSLDYYRTKIFYPEFVLGEIRNFTNSKYPAARIIGGPILCNKKSGCREYKQLDMENTPPVEMNVNRLMFVGTSQTIGAGASELEKTFFSLLHERINKIQEAVSVNISQSALSPEEMLAMFSKNVDLFKPTHVLVNLGYNQATHSFTRVLAEFSAVSKKYNAKIIYISEANNLVETSDYIKELNQFIRQNSLPVIDLYSHLRSSQVNEDISIWWDPVHFNDRGQRLAADFLYEELVKLKLIRTRAH